jgi:mannitol/fructose-specific phosphotransferase system IIA component (Ntr-type)
MDEIEEIIVLIKSYGKFDESVFAGCESYLRQHLARLKEIEEPGQAHAAESTLIHTFNVVKAIHNILVSLKQQSHTLPYLEQLYKLISKEKIQKHLFRKVGNYDRYTLLFFATLFHDIGKIGHFVQTEKSLVELNKYAKHSFLSGFITNFSSEGLDAVSEEIIKVEAEFNRLKKMEEKSKKQKKAYEEARQLKVQLKLIKREIVKHKDLLNNLNFNKKDIEYMVFITSNHMKCYDSFQMLNQIIQNLNNKKIIKQINNLKTKIIEMITHFGDYYFDLILFFVSDKIGTGGFFHSLPDNVVKYIEVVNNIYENRDFDIVNHLIK